MAKVKVTTKFAIVDLLDKFMDPPTVDSVGLAIVVEARQLIASGQSPVRGYGRFEGYKAQQKAKLFKEAARESAARGDKATAKGLRASARDTAQKGYPFNVNKSKYPNKQARPVNLFLSGDMLDGGYGYRQKDPLTLEVGMVGGSEKDKEKAGYINEGTEFMAQRRFIPGPDEEFTISIMRSIRDIYQQRLEFLIRQSNKKE